MLPWVRGVIKGDEAEAERHQDVTRLKISLHARMRLVCSVWRPRSAVRSHARRSCWSYLVFAGCSLGLQLCSNRYIELVADSRSTLLYSKMVVLLHSNIQPDSHSRQVAPTGSANG